VNYIQVDVDSCVREELEEYEGGRHYNEADVIKEHVVLLEAARRSSLGMHPSIVL
jgi:hypothetical protein